MTRPKTARRNRKKFGLVHLGNDEAYGLIFVAGELLRDGHKIKWFDGDSRDVIRKIVEWKPDFICFSPLTTFFNQAARLSKEIKRSLPSFRSVFGGHHVFALPESVKLDGIDIVVIGPVYGTIDKIVNCKGKEVIHGALGPVEKMHPSRREYYEAIPRIANRHRKFIMSRFGCIYSCSYCSIACVRAFYGPKNYNRHWFTRRSVKDLINESRIFLEYDTKEVFLEDADILTGHDIEEWLDEFSHAWKKEIGVSIYANVTPSTVVQSSLKVLKTLSRLVSSVRMGVQAAQDESLKLFNRLIQNEKMVKSAYDRLTSLGIPVKMEFIMGLPIEDPVGDAIESIKMAQRIAAGSFISAFPLMVYPGTNLYTWCKRNKIKLNKDCTMDWYTGIGSIEFDQLTAKRIRNLVKMATMFVKYNIDERWIRSLIDMDLTESASMALSKCQYLESLVFRRLKGANENFQRILEQMNLKY